MKGNLKDCVAEIKAATDDLITSEQAEELLERIENRAKERVASGNLDNIEALMHEDAVKMMTADEMKILNEKKQAAISIVREKNLKEFLTNYKNPGEGLWDFMVGGVKKRFGARLSIDYQGKSIVESSLAELYNALDAHGDKTLELFISGTIDREISKELFELGKVDGKPGITGNKQAQQAAKAVHAIEDKLVDRMNLGGANIRKLEGYIVRQSHDQRAIRMAGGFHETEKAFKYWRDKVAPKLDAEKTFFDAGIDDPEAFLRSTWEALSTGVRKAEAGSEVDAPQLQGFVGPGNLGKKLSHSRKLHFKDADAWFEYNQEFGTKQVRESIEQGLEHAGRNIALLENLGPNYKGLFDKVRGELRETHRMDDKIIKSLDSKELDYALAEIDGSTRSPVDITMARIASGARQLQGMAKLGGSTLSSFGDVPTTAVMLARNGHNIFGAYHKILTSLFRGRGDEETKSMARAITGAMDGIRGESSRRYMSSDGVPGAFSRMQKTFFKLNMMTWWNDASKTAAARGLNSLIADQAHLDFGSIRKSTRENLKLYGIDDNRWDVIRQSLHKGDDGLNRLLPEFIHDIPEEKIVKHMEAENYGKTTKNNIERYRNEVETQIRTYFLDQAEIGVPNPGAAERVIMNRGTSPGTVEGEFMRTMMQFKGFPIAMVRKGVGMEMYSRGAETMGQALKNGNGELVGLAHMIAATSGFGYLAMVAKDFFKGKDQRHLLDENYVPDPKVIMAAMAQGGGFGIYGDFLFGEYSRTGRSALAALAGPNIGQIDDVMNIYTRMRNGDDAAAATFKQVLSNTPYLNLFYTRTILDYLILYNLQETMNPGYLQRMESRTAKDQKQTFKIPPSTVIPRGGDLTNPTVGATGAAQQINQMIGGQ